LHESRDLFRRHVAHNGENHLTWGVFPGVKAHDVGMGNLVERFFSSVQRPAIGMAMKDQLIEGFHCDMAWIVVVARHFPKYL
jgi:hypothetical protein